MAKKVGVRPKAKPKVRRTAEKKEPPALQRLAARRARRAAAVALDAKLLAVAEGMLGLHEKYLHNQTHDHDRARIRRDLLALAERVSARAQMER